MIIPIQIQQLNPDANNRRVELAKSPITFGREASCDIVVAEEFASRQHGELQFKNDHWILVNKSANGTQVNGKRITRKPARLKDGDKIAIGGQPVMALTIIPPVPTPAAAQSTDSADTQSATPKKKKLWIFIGVYFALIIVLSLFLATLKEDTSSENGLPPALTPAQIEDEIFKPVTPLPINDRIHNEHLQYATEAYNRRDVDIDALYDALTDYRKALAYSGSDEFSDSLDQRCYFEVQQQLLEQITLRYQRAYNLLQNRNYQQANREFRELARLYPVNDRRKSRVFANIEDMIKASKR